MKRKATSLIACMILSMTMTGLTGCTSDDVTKLQASYKENTEDLSALEAKLTALAAKVDENIKTLSEATGVNASGIKTNKDDIKNNADDIAEIKENETSMNTIIQANKSNIEALQTKYSALAEKVETMKTDITTNKNAILALQNSFEAFKTSINATIETVQASITALETRTASLEDRMDDMEDGALLAKADFDALSTKVDGIVTDIVGIKKSIAANLDRIIYLEAKTQMMAYANALGVTLPVEFFDHYLLKADLLEDYDKTVADCKAAIDEINAYNQRYASSLIESKTTALANMFVFGNYMYGINNTGETETYFQIKIKNKQEELGLTYHFETYLNYNTYTAIQGGGVSIQRR
ncbi:MAG: hypothetical protein WCS91_02075 [Bacilli bacterium]